MLYDNDVMAIARNTLEFLFWNQIIVIKNTSLLYAFKKVSIILSNFSTKKGYFRLIPFSNCSFEKLFIK